MACGFCRPTREHRLTVRQLLRPRAQDLTLRHRVKSYRAGDLERRYPELPLQEDIFVNYGLLTPELRALMHPRTARREWDKARWKLALEVLAQVRAPTSAMPWSR